METIYGNNNRTAKVELEDDYVVLYHKEDEEDEEEREKEQVFPTLEDAESWFLEYTETQNANTMKKEIKLIDNVLTTVTTNELTPIGLVFEFLAEIECYGEREVSASYDEPACGGVEFQECTLTIGDSEKNCYAIFEKNENLQYEIERAVEHFEGETGTLSTESSFTDEYVPCLVDLETKQIFFIEKDKSVFDTDLKKWITTDFIHEITKYVPSDVLYWNLEQALIED